jgi:hypothetical protein
MCVSETFSNRRLKCIGNAKISTAKELQGQLGPKGLYYDSAENRKAEVSTT